MHKKVFKLNMSSSCKHELTFAVFLLALCSCHAMQNQEPASKSKTDFTKLTLDENITRMLKQCTTADQFANKISIYGSKLGREYAADNVRDLFNLFDARRRFEEPCNMNSLLIFGHAYIRHLTSFRDPSLKRVMQHLLDDKPADKYVAKCFAEFDLLAADSFAEDKRAMQQLTLKLLSALSRQTRDSPTFELIKSDLNIKKTDNNLLKVVIENSNFERICREVNGNEKIRPMLKLMQRILGSKTKLRTNEIMAKLKQQITNECSIDASKLMVLSIFCNNLTENQELKIAALFDQKKPY